jgi:hypothetical protein
VILAAFAVARLRGLISVAEVASIAGKDAFPYPRF